MAQKIMINKVLITGHSGFIGGWLTALLSQRGYEIKGISATCSTESLGTRVANKLGIENTRVDITDHIKAKELLVSYKPDLIIHLASQSIVAKAKDDPHRTYETNVMGIATLLHGVDCLNYVPYQIFSTTDKVYATHTGEHVNEDTPIKGQEPYSYSKVMQDKIIQSWCNNNEERAYKTVILRMGNIIGGGDHNESRIVPTVINALKKEDEIELRNPNGVRPWQHVRDIIDAIENIIVRMDKGEKLPRAVNIGPEKDGHIKVKELVEKLAKEMGKEFSTKLQAKEYKEQEELLLDSNLAKKCGIQREPTSIEEALRLISDWEKLKYAGIDELNIIQKQLR